jgi:hypothetical protein
MPNDDTTKPAQPPAGTTSTPVPGTSTAETYPGYKVTFLHPGGETKVMEGPHTDVVQLGDASITLTLDHRLKTPLPSGGFAPNLTIKLTRS